MDLADAEKMIRETQQYAKTILNSLSAHIAIIDENGVVLETNVALRAVIRKNDEDAGEMEQAILQNIRDSILPKNLSEPTVNFHRQNL